MTEGKQTTVLYVWDVYDRSGNRLHRINGQREVAGSNGGEGWNAVPAAGHAADRRRHDRPACILDRRLDRMTQRQLPRDINYLD